MAFANLFSPKILGPNFFLAYIYIYKNPRNNLQNPWTSHFNFWNRNIRNRHKPDHLLPEYKKAYVDRWDMLTIFCFHV